MIGKLETKEPLVNEVLRMIERMKDSGREVWIRFMKIKEGVNVGAREAHNRAVQNRGEHGKRRDRFGCVRRNR